MAQKIASYPVLDFSGGVRRDKSSFEFQKNELLDARNVEINESGRIKVKRGSHQIGQTLSNTLENSFSWERVVGGSTPVSSIYVNDNASTATVRRLLTSRLTTAITSASTTVVISGNATNYANSGNDIIEIDGDLISYTGNNGSNTFTGVTGIVGNHPAGASVNQWISLSLTTAINGSLGVYYAVLNNILIFGGYAAAWDQIANDNGTTTSAVTGEPSGIFHTVYRDRLYVVGDGSAGTNGDVRRISFSARGSGVDWTDVATNTFLVEDQRGEGITAQRVLNDNLLLFKTNSIFTYDEIELKQRIIGIGAWNHKTPVEIDGIIYTFCPRGIFATNGFSAKQIGEPVRQYWQSFQPQVDAVTLRVVTNTFGTKFRQYYLVYIHNITDPDTTNDVVLCYDTIKKSWSVWTGFTNIRHFLGTDKFTYGDRALQFHPALFGGDTAGKYFRFFENRYIDGQATPVNQGSDIFTDLVSNTTLTGGTPTPAVIETPLYDLTHPELFKTFKKLRVYTENGQWNIQYRVQNENGITDYKQLGTTDKIMKVLSFPKEAQGYRCGFKITGTNTSSQSVFNGFIFEDTEVISRT